jgi:uncharacterized protein YjbJ (UPF0337 family)
VKLRAISESENKEKTMNWDQVESRWKDLTSSLKENWGKLTDVDLEEISGKREQLTSKVQTVYGITKKEADKQVWDWARTLQRPSRTIA